MSSGAMPVDDFDSGAVLLLLAAIFSWLTP
jgi:hypothetical protein